MIPGLLSRVGAKFSDRARPAYCTKLDIWMDENRRSTAQAKASADFSQFWRIPEGNSELLSARYSQQPFGRHCHERYAIGVISHGAERLYYRGAHHLGGAASVVTLTPGEIHDGLPGSAEGWAYRMLYIDPTWLNEVVLRGRFGREHVHLFRDALTVDPLFARTFLQRHQLIEHSPPSLERETLLLDLLDQLFQRTATGRQDSDAREREAVKRIKHRLDQQFDQTLSLDELARHAGLDPLYMIRVFKQSVGISPHSYQIQKRIARVQALLRGGSGLAEAAFACGFFDQSHMARAFKKVVGVTPGRFRLGQ